MIIAQALTVGGLIHLLIVLVIIGVILWASPSIRSLFFSSCPTTIGWFVVSVIVHTIQREIRWSIAHICKKILEIVSPSLAYRNAAAAVILVGTIARIAAALFHPHPYSIFGSHRSVFCHAMARLPNSYQSCLLTTTGLNDSKVLFPYPMFTTAIANAFPICIGFDLPIGTDDKEAAKSLPGQID